MAEEESPAECIRQTVISRSGCVATRSSHPMNLQIGWSLVFSAVGRRNFQSCCEAHGGTSARPLLKVGKAVLTLILLRGVCGKLRLDRRCHLAQSLRHLLRVSNTRDVGQEEPLLIGESEPRPRHR